MDAPASGEGGVDAPPLSETLEGPAPITSEMAVESVDEFVTSLERENLLRLAKTARAIADGKSQARIAQEQGLSEATVSDDIGKLRNNYMVLLSNRSPAKAL
jgi:hypothetical protein